MVHGSKLVQHTVPGAATHLQQHQEQVEKVKNPVNNTKRAVDRHIPSGIEAKFESTSKIEKFSASDLGNLRMELMQSGIDSWQAADVLSDFLTLRGYGVVQQSARDAIVRLEGTDRDLNCIQEELEHVAFVM